MIRSRSILFSSLVSLLALASTACGDDDATDGGVDGGGGVDSGRTDGGPRDGGPDGGPMGMDGGPMIPLPECDPFDSAGTCAEGTECKLVIWDPNPDPAVTDDIVLFYGCVDGAIPRRSEGVICDRVNDLTPTDPDDTLFTDDCDVGMFCWRSLDDRFERCRRMCGDDRVECETDQFCITLNSEPVLATCDQTSPCDPVYQVGCPDADACYILRNTYEDVVGRCLPQAVADGGVPAAVGDPCTSLDACPRGSVCIPEILPDGGMGEMANCRATCAAGMGMDGGVPADGGAFDGGVVFTGTCGTGTTCVAVPLDMGMSRVPTPVGVCQ